MNPLITAIGTANPPYRTEQCRISEFMARAHGMEGEEKQRLKALYRATGIKYRYSVIEDYGAEPGDYRFYNPDLNPFPGTNARNEVFRKQALPLAMAAIKDCLPGDFDLTSITHLVTVSCTGLYAPGLDIELVETLGLPCHTKRTAINFMGCYAAFNALKTAKDICTGYPNAKVLIVCVELCSLHFQKNPTPDFILSNALFGDGAAAALVENSSPAGLMMMCDHCALIPQGKSHMSWQVGDTGFEMMLSDKIPQLIEPQISQLTDELLGPLELKLSDIEYFAIHPGGKRILTGIQQALGVPSRHNRFSLQVLKEYGNMSSATILFVLKEIWNNLNFRDHQKNLLCFAFGPGLTLEGMIMKIYWPDEN